MVISKAALAKIKKIIDNNYDSLLFSLVGTSAFSKEDLDRLTAEGFEPENPQESLLEMLYYNYVMNDIRSPGAPHTIQGMREQQHMKPYGDAHNSAEEHVNQNFIHVVEKMKANVKSRIEGLIRDNNHLYRNNSLQNLDRPDELDQLVKESTLGKLKQNLREYSLDANRDWERIAITETANALGLGSVDRVIIQNKDTPAEQIYVYRIPVNDTALCKHCRKFYLDKDSSPKVYRLSTLLNNGTNYGKPTAEWNPVVGATHPNDRESGVLQLRPGWKVMPGGGVEFIGQTEWEDYIKKKVTS